MISGSKVLLRMPEKEDLEFVYDLANAEENRQFVGIYRPMFKKEEEDWITSTMQKAANGTDYVFIIIDKKTKRPIGNCGIHGIDPISRYGRIGIHPKLQNKGYGTDAIKAILKFGFESLNLHIIYISAIENNKRAIHLYKEKLKFRYEATLRDRHYKNGRYLGEIVFSMTKDEWEKLYKQGRIHGTKRA
ncbi:MAG: GNAT family N-acetyltransferase [Candidatus Micrarchaeia archaeon]